MKPTTLADTQLSAYNKQNLEDFLNCYSEDVEISNFPDILICKGKDAMRSLYINSWKENPNQKAIIINRIHVVNTVMDHEHVTGRANGIELHVIAIYKIENDKINKVYFVRE